MALKGSCCGCAPAVLAPLLAEEVRCNSSMIKAFKAEGSILSMSGIISSTMCASSSAMLNGGCSMEATFCSLIFSNKPCKTEGSMCCTTPKATPLNTAGNFCKNFRSRGRSALSASESSAALVFRSEVVSSTFMDEEGVHSSLDGSCIGLSRTCKESRNTPAALSATKSSILMSVRVQRSPSSSSYFNRKCSADIPTSADTVD
mmetsp:Transcript_81826/g.128874  ORF Transcript_81826/g.128874 Transcript_81826/m.128874 type:complete len:203 (+) Transcript_81826:777-1385(+)